MASNYKKSLILINLFFYLGTSRLTMKLDGTCCMIREFNSRPWLWARHDVKPNKSTDKKFKSYLHNKNEHEIKGEGETYPAFEWNIETDFKEFPDNWISASGKILNKHSSKFLKS